MSALYPRVSGTSMHSPGLALKSSTLRPSFRRIARASLLLSTCEARSRRWGRSPGRSRVTISSDEFSPAFASGSKRLKFRIRHLAWVALLAAGSVFAASGRVVLPANVTPLHYELEFTPQPDKMQFSAHVRIDIAVREPTRTITLNAAALEFDKVSLSTVAAAPQIHLDAKRETASFEFAGDVPR